MNWHSRRAHRAHPRDGTGRDNMLRRVATSAVTRFASGSHRGIASSASARGWWSGSDGDDHLGAKGADGASTGELVVDVTERVGETISGDAAVAATSGLIDASSSFDPVGIAATAIEQAHVMTGLPWWATFGCTALAVRASLFPFVLKQTRAGVLLNTVKARARGPDGKPPETFQEVITAAGELRRRTNGTPLYWLVAGPLIQLPVFITAVLAVRRLAVTPGIGMETGGALWFPNLTEVALHMDAVVAPMGMAGAVLPCATAAALFLNVNSAWGKMAESNAGFQFVKLALEWLTLPTLLVGMVLPQAVHCYWLPSSASALAQSQFMRSEWGRRMIRADPRLPARSAASVDSASDASNLRFSRPLEEDEERAMMEAAKLIADKKEADAAKLLEAVAGGGKDAGKALAHNGAHPNLLFALGQTRQSLKQWKPAVEAYDACAAAEVHPMQRARALHGAGVSRARLGDLRGAARCLEEAIDASQSAGVAHVKAMLSLASVRKTDGDAAGAMEALKQAEKHAPEVRERYIEPLEKQMAKDKKGKRR